MEQAGAQRPFRILQKRGVFVDCEDFLPVTGTYPEHPLSKIEPKAHNVAELKQQRLQALREDVQKKSMAFEAHNKTVKAQISRIPDEGYVENPTFTSIH